MKNGTCVRNSVFFSSAKWIESLNKLLCDFFGARFLSLPYSAALCRPKMTSASISSPFLLMYEFL